MAYAPEITMNARDKTEEAIANLRACGEFPVTGCAHEQPFARDIFSLPHKKRKQTSVPVFQRMYLSQKIRESFLMYTNK